MTKITLYHSEWCSHCRDFKPVWDKLKPLLKKNNIEYNSYEYPNDLINFIKDGVEEFPTIKINKNGTDYEYKGEREYKKIKKELLDENVQTGGSGGIIEDEMR